MTVDGSVGGADSPGWRPGFIEYLLGGLVVLMITSLVLGITLYLLPVPHLELSELQPTFRVAHTADLPVGASRVVNWGDRVILVVRTGEGSFTALQGNAPTDGCILEWDPASLQVRSPCTYLVYDLHGDVVRGLTTLPLRRYSVFVRQDVVYVTGS